MDAVEQLLPFNRQEEKRFRKITLAPNFHPPPVIPPPLAWTPRLGFARWLVERGKLNEWRT